MNSPVSGEDSAFPRDPTGTGEASKVLTKMGSNPMRWGPGDLIEVNDPIFFLHQFFQYVENIHGCLPISKIFQ